mgnify:FL=1
MCVCVFLLPLLYTSTFLLKSNIVSKHNISHIWTCFQTQSSFIQTSIPNTTIVQQTHGNKQTHILQTWSSHLISLALRGMSRLCEPDLVRICTLLAMTAVGGQMWETSAPGRIVWRAREVWKQTASIKETRRGRAECKFYPCKYH